ncbi:DinB family protein [bacterium]|nr:DinB family protein [bacterium]
MVTGVLARQFRFTAHVVGVNLEGMTQDQALVHPPTGGSSASWILGHILTGRNGVHFLLGLEPALSREAAAPYERGSASGDAGNPGIPLADLLALFHASQEKIAAAIPDLVPEQLASVVDLPPPLGRCTVAEGLGLLQFHEAYHAGQLGVLRRLAGLPGAIA